ncbi:Uncharacterised protein [BD1-7 clade bacterium]|uniref:Uncharacterized protein n=1 Tax=BD1-7 clade bacterium TaxID=2029982 RepID=A0A5S9N077_9GAMM|nr:Uncharacterised protein [BD1-7 clade bacterium]CAA0082979.1 Uncharacterised protein [BD1-7 clade bacterium]
MLPFNLHTQHVQCAFCHEPLTAGTQHLFADTPYASCADHRCVMLARQIHLVANGMPETQLAFKIQHCHQQRMNQIRADAERKTIRAHQYERTQAALVTAYPQTLINDAAIIDLPSGPAQTIKVSAARISAYQQHLEKIIAAAIDASSEDDFPNDNEYSAPPRRQEMDDLLAGDNRLREVSDSCCSYCKGGCCVLGKDHAYLLPITLFRYLRDHPDETPQALLQRYLDLRPEVVMADSCINHTPQGCALPRELRSEICNGYYCDSLKTWHKHAKNIDTKNNGEEPSNTWVYIAQWSYHNWNQTSHDDHQVIATDRIQLH